MNENSDPRSAIVRDAVQAMKNGHSIIKEYELQDGKVEVFIEVVQSPMPLVILEQAMMLFPCSSREGVRMEHHRC